MGDIYTYWILRYLLLVILIVCGYGISYRKSNNFNIYAGISLVAYSIIVGMRYGRGRDYFHYYQDISTNMMAPGCTIDPEPLYKLWINTLYNLKVPPEVVFVFYSFLLLLSFLLVLKNDRKIACWALPVFYLITNTVAENAIRQCFALSFVILAYYFYQKNKLIGVLSSLIIAMNIHFSSIVVLFLFIFFGYAPIKIKSSKYLIIIYLLMLFAWQASLFDSVTDLLTKYDVDFGKSSYYIENSDRFLSSDSELTNHKASVVTLLMQAVSSIMIIYYGVKLTSKEHKYNLPFAFSYLAIIIYQIGSNMEMYLRIFHWLSFMYPIMVGFIMTKLEMKRKQKLIFGVVIAVYTGYHFFASRMFILNDTGYMFLWDR